MTLLFKIYRNKPGQLALGSLEKTKRIKKDQVRAFLRAYFPEAKDVRIRILNRYKKGSLAVVKSHEKLWKA